MISGLLPFLCFAYQLLRSLCGIVRHFMSFVAILRLLLADNHVQLVNYPRCLFTHFVSSKIVFFYLFFILSKCCLLHYLCLLCFELGIYQHVICHQPPCILDINISIDYWENHMRQPLLLIFVSCDSFQYLKTNSILFGNAANLLDQLEHQQTLCEELFRPHVKLAILRIPIGMTSLAKKS